MNDTRLQGWIDELHGAGAQQWFLRGFVVLAPLGAMSSAALEVGRWWPFGLLVVSALAIASAFRPDSQTALAVIAIIVWHWLAVVEPVDTLWLPVAACCLLAYHSLVALTATFPVGGVVPTATLSQWLRRTAVGCAATLAMWVLVVLMDRRGAAGNALLTALALVVVAVAALLVRARSLDDAT